MTQHTHTHDTHRSIDQSINRSIDRSFIDRVEVSTSTEPHANRLEPTARTRAGRRRGRRRARDRARDGDGATRRATHDDDGSVDRGSNEPAREGIDERLGRLHGSPAAERGPPAAAERRWGERRDGGERERDGGRERERDGRGDASDDDERARAGENVGIRPAASAQSTGGGERALERRGWIVRRCVETTGKRRRECECECECECDGRRRDGW